LRSGLDAAANSDADALLHAKVETAYSGLPTAASTIR
jgi:hypothetical protein